MSKAAEPVPAKKANSKDALLIKCVLEDVLPTSSDAVIKVKTFKKFLDYDLKTLNITGELETYTHKNGFTHTKVAVTYQDKKTNKVNYLEIDVLDNTNTNKKVENGNRSCNPGTCYCDTNAGYSLYCPLPSNKCCNYSNYQCCNDAGCGYPVLGCDANGVVYGTVTTNTVTGGAAGSSAAKTGKAAYPLIAGTQVKAESVGTQYSVFRT
jgi:hypothetical protein